MSEGWAEFLIAFVIAVGVTIAALYWAMIGFIAAIHGFVWGWLVLLAAISCVAIAVWVVSQLFPRNE